MANSIRSQLSLHNGVFAAHSILKDAASLMKQDRKARAMSLLRNNLPKDVPLRDIKTFVETEIWR